MDYSLIRGFNYQPSYGSTGFEIWQKFDQSIIRTELARGKKHFPGMNAIRLWLSLDAFARDGRAFAAKFEEILQIAEHFGMLVMPVLFNRWHDPLLDYGGTYVDHFFPKLSWVQGADLQTPYLEAIVGGHADDPRILAWDLCNEPFAYLAHTNDIPEIYAAEIRWLEGLYRKCKDLNALAPVTLGTHPSTNMADIVHISDLISVHPYWTADSPPHSKKDYEDLLNYYVRFAEEHGKPLLATETCWGATDDSKRVDIIRYTLGELKKRRIGWTVYLLHHSLIADAHRAEFGPVGPAGNLSFIEADGSLRPGHEVFNEF